MIQEKLIDPISKKQILRNSINAGLGVLQIILLLCCLAVAELTAFVVCVFVWIEIDTYIHETRHENGRRSTYSTNLEAPQIESKENH